MTKSKKMGWVKCKILAENVVMKKKLAFHCYNSYTVSFAIFWNSQGLPFK